MNNDHDVVADIVAVVGDVADVVADVDWVYKNVPCGRVHYHIGLLCAKGCCCL